MPTTFYLVYRPQNFSDLDSTQAKEALEKIFSSGKFPHAFLFSGPKGIGKTSAARIVAKAVNCIGRDKNYEPCNQCYNCLSITAGTNVDIIEADAASNRGIEDIKELREKIKLAPASLKYKVYIIDEAHMLTPEAFNALLKTLEEPPKHAIFILCTTDPEKLPKTIVSRCQRVNFKKAAKGEIIARLKKICQAEKLKFEEKGLEEIVKLSDGSFRDAVKILEQVSFAGEISLKEVQKTAGILGEFAAVELLKLLKEKKTKEVLEWVNAATLAGVNLKILIENMTEILRVCLVSNFGIVPDEEPGIEFSPEEARVLISLFVRAYQELKSAIILQLPLEMAVIEWTCPEGIEEQDEPNEPKIKNPPGKFDLKTVVSKWPEILEKVRPLNHSVQAFLRASRPISLTGEFITLEVFYKFHKDQLEKEQCRKVFEQAASEVLNCPVRLKCILGEKPSRPPKPAEPGPQTKQESSQVVSSPNLDDADIIKIAEEIFNGGSLQ